MKEPGRHLALLDQARAALERVQDIGQALEIHDQAEAIRHFCAVRDRSDEAAIKAAEIKLRAARRVGELLPEKKAGPGRGKKESAARILLPLPPQRASEFRKIAAVDPETFEEHIAGKVGSGEQPSQVQLLRIQKELERESRRAANREKIQATATDEKRPKVSAAKYATIVADPPWSAAAAGVVDVYGRSNPQYSMMGVEAIADLMVDGRPVRELADDDSHLYLWVTNRTIWHGPEIMSRWGFRYAGLITWCKPSIGMGQNFRNSTEHLLFGIRGSQPLKVKNQGTWFSAKRGPAGHSSKPGEFYELVDRCSPGPVLEIFSRNKREGWVSWGEGE